MTNLIKKFSFSHTKEKPVKCTFMDCDKYFQSQSTLRNHMKSHLGIRPHKCDWQDCGKRFRDATGLKQHYRRSCT